MLKDIVNTIKDDDTIWVMREKEGSDSIFEKYITDKLSSSTYAIVSKGMAYIFVHKLDEANIHALDKNYSKVYIYEDTGELLEYIIKVLDYLKYPKNILLSYSTMSDRITDVMPHGYYLNITRLFRKIYKLKEKSVKFSSAENNIYEFISKNTDEDIKRMKILASLTDEILKRSFFSIKENQTELEIAKNTVDIMNEYLNDKKDEYDIAHFDVAWNVCPIVLVGKNLSLGGHAQPSLTKIKKGDTIYYDFGIKATFKDGVTLYTDMQRMGYMLRADEAEAPEEVMKVFNTLTSSIKAGISKMKAGIRAYKIDEIVRGTILQAGYNGYPHATGHSVGRDVHGAGALISVKGSRRSNLKLVDSCVYTLEPRIDIENGGSIEEMILVTKEGAEPLCSLQDKIYLV